jgi:hypothetical protein
VPGPEYLTFLLRRCSGRDDHQMHWPLWAAVNYSLTPSGGLTSEILFA